MMDFSTVQTLARALGYRAIRKAAFCEGERQAAAKWCPSAACCLKSVDGMTVIYCPSFILAFEKLQEIGRQRVQIGQPQIA